MTFGGDDHHYWKASEASKKLQILDFDAIMKSKLLYGMETAQLTDAVLNKIDAFQIKWLRKILGKKHRYWDRSTTHYNLLQMASRIVSTTKKRKNTKQ